MKYIVGAACIANGIKSVLHTLINEDHHSCKVNQFDVRLDAVSECKKRTNKKQKTKKEEKLNLPGLLLCIDFEKAYDSLDRTFMLKVTRSFGFGNNICGWTETFYTKQSVVIVNLQPSQWLDIYKSCRPGGLNFAIYFQSMCKNTCNCDKRK